MSLIYRCKGEGKLPWLCENRVCLVYLRLKLKCFQSGLSDHAKQIITSKMEFARREEKASGFRDNSNNNEEPIECIITETSIQERRVARSSSIVSSIQLYGEVALTFEERLWSQKNCYNTQSNIFTYLFNLSTWTRTAICILLAVLLGNFKFQSIF